MALQLFLMKRGGQEIYLGPLGHHSHHLIEYFEVEHNGPQKCVCIYIYIYIRLSTSNLILSCRILIDMPFSFVQGIQGVSKIKDGYNPATWMLEITSSAHEADLGVDFAQILKNSELYRYVCYAPQDQLPIFRKMLRNLVSVMWLKLVAKSLYNCVACDSGETRH